MDPSTIRCVRMEYQAPPAEWRPCRGEVHVCLVPLVTPPDQLLRLQQLLTAEEQARASRFRTRQLGDRFIASRAVLRAILGASLCVHPASVPFEYGRYGKPYVPGTSIRFNLSHSDGWALIAIGREGEIGADIEKVRVIADRDAIARRHFCAEELADLLSVEGAERDRGFFLYWTQKEAYVKALGAGLNTPLDSFRVSTLAEWPPVLLRSSERSPFELCDVSPNRDLAAAVAVAGSPPRLRTWQFETAAGCVAHFRACGCSV